jgi:hypothetical protein
MKVFLEHKLQTAKKKKENKDSKKLSGAQNEYFLLYDCSPLFLRLIQTDEG